MYGKLETYYNAGLEKVEYLAETLKGFPHTTKNAKWLTNQNGHWTGGFWTGLLWLDSLQKDTPELQKRAKEWAMKLTCRMGDCSTHDQGFIFGPSCVLGYRITGDKDFLPLIHAGAENMIKQYVPEAGLVRAWAEEGYQGISIVDTIMNLPILWISGELLDDPVRKELCLQVAENIQTHAVRKDFSTYHVVKWDEAFRISGDTHQGYASESCWSRGQAWALYGFANMYRYSGCIAFLNTALALGEYYWAHLNEDLLPAWDFTFQNDPSMPIDASASSIAASGMALIASLLEEKKDEASAVWWDRAARILKAETELCFYEAMEDYGLVRRAVVDYPHDSGIGESTMYGDYYCMEAIYRCLHRDDHKATSLLY